MILIILFLFFALALDYLLGEPPTRFHPICFVGNLAEKVENFLRKGENGFNMSMRGFLAWFLVLLPSISLPIFTVLLAYFLSKLIFFENFFSFLPWIMALFWLWICLAPKSLAEHANCVAKALKAYDLPRAQYALSMIVGRNTYILDQYAVARASVETVAENLTDGVLSSLFWSLCGIIAGVLLSRFGENDFNLLCPLLITFFITLHRATNVLDAMWGKKNEKYINFGTMSAITDDILNYIPARLGLFCVAFASIFIPHLNSLQSLFIGIKYRSFHESPNSAWTESAFAGALHLKLGGPAHYAGISVNHPWLGVGTKNATASHIEKSICLMWTSSLFFAFFSSFIIFFTLKLLF